MSRAFSFTARPPLTGRSPIDPRAHSLISRLAAEIGLLGRTDSSRGEPFAPQFALLVRHRQAVEPMAVIGRLPDKRWIVRLLNPDEYAEYPVTDLYFAAEPSADGIRVGIDLGELVDILHIERPPVPFECRSCGRLFEHWLDAGGNSLDEWMEVVISRSCLKGGTVCC